MSKTSRDTPISLTGDDHLNHELSANLANMRGGMVQAAETREMPRRFSAVPHPDRAAMVIVDEETGRSTTVGLYAYGATRDALQELFG